MKTPAAPRIARTPLQNDLFRNTRRFPNTIRPLATAFALLLLCGCSTLNRDWRKAAQQPIAANSMEGRWKGTWLSQVNGHTGGLRGLFSQESDTRYRARFRATYAKLFHFDYTVLLDV
jgi:hypothetical protein